MNKITIELTEDQLREVEAGINKLIQLSRLIPFEENVFARHPEHRAEEIKRYKKAEIKLAFRKRILTTLAKAKS